MCCGVGKWGSPAPRSTKSAPDERSFSASFTTARVAETSMRLMRSVKGEAAVMVEAVICVFRIVRVGGEVESFLLRVYASEPHCGRGATRLHLCLAASWIWKRFVCHPARR